MRTTTQTVGRIDRVVTLLLVLLLVPALLGGCDGGILGGGSGAGSGGGGQNQNGVDEGGTSSDQISLTSDVALSGNRNYTILYTVPTTATSVRAFYAPAGQGDDRSIWTFFDFATPLSAGSSEFTISTADLDRGSWVIGVSYVTAQGEPGYVLSSGKLIIQGVPSPTFVAPSESATVLVGAVVPIAVDLGDPEGDVAWRLFYISQETAPDLSAILPNQVARMGTELAAGTGNAASHDWSTTSVAVGTYLIGVSATDSGFAVDEAAAAGFADQIITAYSDVTVDVIKEEPRPMPPEITITEPAEATTLFLSGSVQITFTVDIFEGTLEDVQVFYDQDSTFDNGIAGVITSGDSSLTSAALDVEDVDEGVYYLGVSADDGQNSRVVAYAPGTVTVVKTATLEVTSPGPEGVAVRPSETVSISWTTNVPAAMAQTEVFALRDSNGDFIGEGAEITIQSAASTGGTSVSWTPTGLIGRFLVGVRLLFDDEPVDPVLAQSQGHIRVSTSPTIIWVGSFAEDTDDLAAGALFEGVQSEDNLGSAFTPVGDLDSDGSDEFLMISRYGKPFFFNPDGIGHGEAYLIYGKPDRLRGRYNVNSVGTEALRGVTFTGIRTPQGNTETDGLSDVSSIPDVDDDGRPELVFGFPSVASRGHNVDPEQDGVVDPRTLATLEREDQFLRGGIVIVSSTNSALRNPEGGSSVINLDLVGQNFESTCVGPEPEAITEEDVEGIEQFQEPEFYQDVISFDESAGSDGLCVGTCDEPSTDGDMDSTNTIDFGFVRALARDFLATYSFSWHIWGRSECSDETEPFLNDNPCVFWGEYCREIPPGCDPTSPGLHRNVDDVVEEIYEYYDYYNEELVQVPIWVWNGLSGFYKTWLPVGDDDFRRNEPLEPSGARVIGVGLEDQFGTSLTLSHGGGSGAGDIIVSAPNRTARGILLGPNPSGCDDPPQCGGEIDGLESSPGAPKTNSDSGVAYMFALRSLWTDGIDSDGFLGIPPKPHQYIVGEASHCGGPFGTIDNIDAVRIAGAPNEKISNILGISDFNGDGRNDFAVGAPDADGGNGRIYVAFRRDTAIEGDYVLEKLELDVSDPERLSGALITGSVNSRFAFSMATDVDLNGDGVADLFVGAPGADGDTGEVVVIYASPSLITPANGTSVDQLIAEGRASKITGFGPGDHFGFNVTSGGDIDGDGTNDLLIAAPGGTPYYDADPFDADDTLNTPGLDLDRDGQLDDVTGSFGQPDGEANSLDQLPDAGLAYIIWGSNCLSAAGCPDTDNQTNVFSIADLGATGLEGAIVVGRRAGDYFGGGDAGEPLFGGISAKEDRGRSYGLRAAGDVDGDGLADFLVGSVVATPRIDPTTGQGTTRGGEAYLVYGFGR